MSHALESAKFKFKFELANEWGLAWNALFYLLTRVHVGVDASSSSSSSSSLKFLEWPKQQRHHEDHYMIAANLHVGLSLFLMDRLFGCFSHISLISLYVIAYTAFVYICLSVCLLSNLRKTADRIFTKISPRMYFGQGKCHQILEFICIWTSGGGRWKSKKLQLCHTVDRLPLYCHARYSRWRHCLWEWDRNFSWTVHPTNK